MNRVTEQIRAASRAVSAVRTLPQTFAIVWLSVIALACLLARPAVIQGLGARYWLMAMAPLLVLLFILWGSFVLLIRNDPRAFPARK